jgi:hypothetical protein
MASVNVTEFVEKATKRLIWLQVFAFIALGYLCLAVALLLWLWLCGIQPSQLRDNAGLLLQSDPVKALTWAGVTALVALGALWKAQQWAARRLYVLLARYVAKDFA